MQKVKSKSVSDMDFPDQSKCAIASLPDAWLWKSHQSGGVVGQTQSPPMVSPTRLVPDTTATHLSNILIGSEAKNQYFEGYNCNLCVQSDVLCINFALM